jgi:hypothetical protein
MSAWKKRAAWDENHPRAFHIIQGCVKPPSSGKEHLLILHHVRDTYVHFADETVGSVLAVSGPQGELSTASMHHGTQTARTQGPRVANQRTPTPTRFGAYYLPSRPNKKDAANDV